MIAEEFLKENYKVKVGVTIEEVMIEFAKYHVEKSLEQASDLATKFLYISIDSEDEDYYKKEILNAYNLENIK